VHLDLHQPDYVNDLDFNVIEYPTDESFDVAYSAAHKVFSDEGVRVLRELVSTHSDYVKRNERQQGTLRGLPYLSKFIRDMVYDESFLAHYSKMAGKPLCPATFGMHSAQVNVGKTGHSNTAVDKWHFDSVDYVVVVILSDLTGMVGGELEVLRLNLGGKEATQKLQEIGIPLEHVEAHSY
jgi:hypothetical protein